MSDETKPKREDAAPGGAEPSSPVPPTQRSAPPRPAEPEAGDGAGVLADLAAMVRFYSRLPMPRLGAADDPAAPPPFGRAIRLLPWASLVVAAPAAAVTALLAPTALPSLVVAGLALAALAFVTGAFHEDGLADVADGFGGGATVERRLEIMKDSRIGAFAGVALAAQFVLRAGLLAEVVERIDGPRAGLVVLGVAAIARVMPLGLMVALPPARPDGLGRAAGRPQPAALGLAAAGAAAIAIVTLLPLAGTLGLALALGLAAASIAGLGMLARAKIGGYTGDVVGAGTIVAEIAAMVGLLA